MEYVTESGLVVRDLRHERGLPPRDNPPNGTPPGASNEYGAISVGPDASEGFGNTHVMYPAGNPPFEAQAWSGWPVQWKVPSGNSSGWMGDVNAMVDLVFACLDLNSSVLATMPPYTLNGATREDPQPPWITNPEPLIYTSWADFAKEMFWSYQAAGEAFILATARYADTGYPYRFMVVAPHLIKITRGEIDGLAHYDLAGNDVTDDLLHLKYASWPGELHGHGPLEVAGSRILAAEALSRYSTELASNGGIPWAVLKYPRRASRPQMAQMQADWVAARRSQMGAPAVLADGVDLEVVSASPRDMALSELAKFNEGRICILLGVPPFLMGLPSGGDSMTYSNVSSLFDYHWRASLRPKASDVMTALSGWLLPRGKTVEIDRDEYVKPGLLERSQAYDILVRIGAMTPNEVRAEERIGPPLPAPATPTARPELTVVPTQEEEPA